MRNRLIAVTLSLLALVGVSVSLAERPAADPVAKALDPDTVALRLILGIGDGAPQDWSGRLAVDRGEILDIEGLRFRDGDLVIGLSLNEGVEPLGPQHPVSPKAAERAIGLLYDRARTYTP